MQFSKDDATFEIRATHKVEGRDGQNESFERTVLDPTADGKAKERRQRRASSTGQPVH